MSEATPLEAIIRRDRLVVIAGLITVALLAWAYILTGAGMTMPMAGMAGDMTAPAAPMAWTGGYALLMFVMWWVMMVAMMLPSAAPMILLFALVNRKQRADGAPYVSSAVFMLGYLFVWGAFSAVATALQWWLEGLRLLSPMMASASVVFGGGLLIAAGVYQLTPLKHACLRHCRGPIQFLSQHWRRGTRGALVMGVHHGAFCLGCCWVLMALLFYGGVMNPYWIIGLALFVLIEKTVPAGHWLANATGVALMVWGGGLIAVAL